MPLHFPSRSWDAIGPDGAAALSTALRGLAGLELLDLRSVAGFRNETVSACPRFSDEDNAQIHCFRMILEVSQGTAHIRDAQTSILF